MERHYHSVATCWILSMDSWKLRVTAKSIQAAALRLPLWNVVREYFKHNFRNSFCKIIQNTREKNREQYHITKLQHVWNSCSERSGEYWESVTRSQLAANAVLRQWFQPCTNFHYVGKNKHQRTCTGIRRNYNPTLWPIFDFKKTSSIRSKVDIQFNCLYKSWLTYFTGYRCVDMSTIIQTPSFRIIHLQKQHYII